ncbi:MAG: nitrite reductase, copper-containing [Mycobacterium sp.]|nr:nitrite reductase, copper-containing [Mycobacterium sp.]
MNASSASNERFWTRLTMVVLAWLTLMLAAAFLIMSPGQNSRANSTTQPAVAANLPTDVTIQASEFKFNPTSLQLPSGKKVTITLQNTGSVEHDFTVDALGVKLSAPAGKAATGEFTLDNPGTYDFYCSVPGHKDAGMHGTLSVMASGVSALAPGPAAQAADPVNLAVQAQGIAAAQATPEPRPVPDGTQPLPAPLIAPPVDHSQPTTVQVELETHKLTALMNDGVAYDYWTFNGTVPGPMIRVLQGDTVELTLKNAPDGGLTHSIDLHAVLGPGGGAKYTQVPPGDSATIRFQAMRPGVYVYHCATPMVSMHIASGMYGLIVVEPPGGLPKADHEFYVMQGDFYMQGDRALPGLRQFDMTKLMNEEPDYVVFNGHVGSLTGDNAMHASVGDLVRIFFGVGGPNLTSSFHMIGEIFDRVYPEGSLTVEPATNVQTTHVSAGGATMVEFTPVLPGTYTIVDHSIERMEKGAAGQMVIDGADNPDVLHVVQAGSGGGGGH